MLGKTILHYKISEKLGEGGMGVVYLAEDTKLKREVAIKFLPRSISVDTEQRERFVVEAQTAAALNHPNISQIYAIEEFEDEIFLVMEYINGKELKEKINEGPIPVEEVINIAIQLAKGLQAAHDKGIIHRDIKSSNIMLLDNGDVKIMDFGLAKISGAAHITKVGVTIGTIAYMPPEQIQSHEVDERADIWSFGVVLYEAVSGKLPFEGLYDHALMYSILDEVAKPVSSLVENVPQNLEAVINNCLQKYAENRYESFSKIIEDLLNPGHKDVSGFRQNSHDEFSNKSKLQTKKSILSYALGGLTILVILLWLFLPSTMNVFRKILNLDSVPDKQHLLVLPLTNIGGDSTKQVFCDGLVETLTSKMTQLEQFHKTLWVVPSSEVRRYKINSPGEAYESFGANLAVTGSFQLIQNIFRLTLNLVDAKNLRQINSAVIDIASEQMASLHDNSVIKLMEMLNLELNTKAEKVIQAGGTRAPGAYEFYIQGRGYLLRYENVENLNIAIKLFTDAIQQDSIYALAYSALGESYWRKYESIKNPELVQKAKIASEAAVKLDDDLAQVNITMGMIYSGTGEYEQAIKYFNNALAAEPTNADAYRGIAKAYQAEGKLDEAELTYKRAISLKPDYWAGYNELGVFYFHNGRYEEAVSQFKQVVNLTPDNYRGYNNLGGIYYMLERWDDAKIMFERSLTIKKSYNILSNLGTLNYIKGNYKKSAEMFEQALELNNNDYLTWGNLAAAYNLIPGKEKPSIDTYRKAILLAEERLKVNPNDANVVSNLAGYYADVGEKSKSIELLEQSIKMTPDNVQIMYRAATTYERLGYRQKALYWIEKALQNGYSRSEIEHQPELKELIADERYENLHKHTEK